MEELTGTHHYQIFSYIQQMEVHDTLSKCHYNGLLIISHICTNELLLYRHRRHCHHQHDYCCHRRRRRRHS